ncbi:MAG: CRISPR-associated protein Cas4 [Chloroflexi bacterium HGW-Chloroflexi-10]|nr:MAG: CRISPR-associated protein Cas4 [Chloroflexi bacterium HGW-Chloroflexi-10]
MIVLALIVLALAVFLFWKSGRQRQESGVPNGRIIYSDPELWGKAEKPFFDVETQLTGKPDYLVKQDDFLIPVEVKSSFAPTEPYASHVYQLLAYCFLVERASGVRPPYGILQYRNRTFAIDYTDEQKGALLELLEEIRADERIGEMERSHEESGRCVKCGFRDVCNHRL